LKNKNLYRHWQQDTRYEKSREFENMVLTTFVDQNVIKFYFVIDKYEVEILGESVCGSNAR